MATGLFPNTAGYAEDILLEYAEDMPMQDVGWGRATRADIDLVMDIHETAFGRIREGVYASSRRGAAMTRVIMAALQGEPIGGGPRTGPSLKLLGLAGHDTNLVLMASTFGLKWKLPDQPDSTAPSTALAFELWRDGDRRFVRAVLFYQALDQQRTLSPELDRRSHCLSRAAPRGLWRAVRSMMLAAAHQEPDPAGDCGWPPRRARQG